MSDAARKIVDRMKKEGESTIAFFQDLKPDQWTMEVYTEGENWSLIQILTHIVEAEGSVPRLIMHILAGGPGVPKDFDLDDYNHRKVSEMPKMSPEDLIHEFSIRRAKTIEMVSGFGKKELTTEGRHPFLGVAPVKDMLKLMTTHIRIHQRDIRKLLLINRRD